jgi:hypothetical protein
VKPPLAAPGFRPWLLAGLLVAGTAAAAWHLAGGRSSPAPTPPVASAGGLTPTPTPGLPWFEDVTAASGVDFVHFNSATPQHYIQETMGSGVAWIDYDNDGWPDLFCVQDCPVRPKPGSALPGSKLYRNNGDGTFTDVTERVGLTHAGYGMGCAVGDFDNDGYDDLLVTYLGEVVLYHNEGDGRGGRRFVDVTAKAGLRNPHWATSCAWGDVDGDGYLDLYICNYVAIDLDKYPDCVEGPERVRISCPPTLFPAAAHRLYHNNGNGTFTDVSFPSGVSAVPPAPGLGVVMVDLDGDGRLDIYVANDLKPSYLFHNQGGGRFVEKGLLSGSGLGPLGTLISGMGVDAGDVDGTGRPSLFVTNFQNKPNVLFRNQGGLLFQEWSTPSGLGGPSINRLAFGTVFVDVDLDGRLDVAVANGHIHRLAERLGAPFEQEAQLFLGEGEGRFREVSEQAGPYFRQRRVGRGLAWADYDNDGRPDLVFSHNGGPVALLHNATTTTNNWLRLELVGDGKKSNRNAIGSRVEVECDGKRLVRFVVGGGSYLSASERRLLIGLGPADHADRVTVIWPSGSKREFANLAGKQWWRLHEGKDQPEHVKVRR